MLLTKRQLEILRFLRDYRARHALAPTLDEMADHFRVSKITIHEHLTHLEQKGALFRARARARGLQVLYDPDAPPPSTGPADRQHLRLVGTIAAGQPLEALEDPVTLDLSEIVPHGENHYLLRVKGDSMADDHILDGDLVIVERIETAQNGQTVVAIIDDNEATLKRFYRENGHIRLQPANSAYPPLIRDRVQIRGVAVGVLRTLR
jgi:repressor LexA